MKFRVKELREKKNLTQEELAKRANISRATISGIENGTFTVIKTDTLRKLADALGVKVSSLFLD